MVVDLGVSVAGIAVLLAFLPLGSANLKRRSLIFRDTATIYSELLLVVVVRPLAVREKPNLGAISSRWRPDCHCDLFPFSGFEIDLNSGVAPC